MHASARARMHGSVPRVARYIIENSLTASGVYKCSCVYARARVRVCHYRFMNSVISRLFFYLLVFLWFGRGEGVKNRMQFLCGKLVLPLSQKVCEYDLQDFQGVI